MFNACLAHHRRLHRRLGSRADGEHTVVAHQHGGRAVSVERLHDALADGVVADQRERPDRDLAAELVGHGGEDAGDGLVTRRPGRGVGGVGVHDPADLGHRAVDVRVRGGVAGGRVLAFDEGAVEVADDHVLGAQVVVRDTGRFDHEQVFTVDPAGDVAGRPGDQVVAYQLRVQGADGGPHDGGSHAPASFLIARSACIMFPSAKKSCSLRYSA
jgi:hypothetical protein